MVNSLYAIEASLLALFLVFTFGGFMQKVYKLINRSILFVGAIFLSTGFTGCGGGGGGGGSEGTEEDTVPVTITLGSSVSAADSLSGFITRAPVDTENIDSLVLEITKVTVHKAGVDEEGENEEESEPLNPDEENENDAGWITLFEASNPGENILLDIVDLSTISQVLTAANLTPGKYTKVALYYENPVAVVDGVESSAIQSTANGRIFISQNFTVPEGGPVLIEIDFKEIGLNSTGGGPNDYILNPQLRVDIGFTSALIEFAGTIVGIVPEPQTLSVDSGTSILDVAVDEETVIVRQQEVVIPDAIPPDPLTEFVEVAIPFGNLMNGDMVEVDGELQLDGSIVADRIEVVPPLLLP